MIEFREFLQYRCIWLFHLYTGIFSSMHFIKDWIELIMKKTHFKLMHESKIKRECVYVCFLYQ